jgi:hypothetical protein
MLVPTNPPIVLLRHCHEWHITCHGCTVNEVSLTGIYARPLSCTQVTTFTITQRKKCKMDWQDPTFWDLGEQMSLRNGQEWTNWKHIVPFHSLFIFNLWSCHFLTYGSAQLWNEPVKNTHDVIKRGGGNHSVRITWHFFIAIQTLLISHLSLLAVDTLTFCLIKHAKGVMGEKIRQQTQLIICRANKVPAVFYCITSIWMATDGISQSRKKTQTFFVSFQWLWVFPFIGMFSMQCLIAWYWMVMHGRCSKNGLVHMCHKCPFVMGTRFMHNYTLLYQISIKHMLAPKSLLKQNAV